jgi:hypothetical protein
MASKDNILLVFKFEFDNQPPESKYIITLGPDNMTREQYLDGLVIITNIGTFYGKWIDGEVSHSSVNNKIDNVNVTLIHFGQTQFSIDYFRNSYKNEDGGTWIDDMLNNITIELLKGG